MPNKRILKNHCNKCKYYSSHRESSVCACGLYPYYDDNNEPGCNHKESTLSKLFRYTEMERYEAYHFRYYDLTLRCNQLAISIMKKEERGEEVPKQEYKIYRLLSEDADLAQNMAFDHKRCNFIRLINELDEKGEFKRLLKKLGRYPEFIDDFKIEY